MEHWFKMGQENSLTLSSNLCVKKRDITPCLSYDACGNQNISRIIV